MAMTERINTYTDMKWMNDRDKLDKFIDTFAAEELNSWILTTRSLLKFQQSIGIKMTTIAIVQ